MTALADVLITSIPVEPSRPYTYRIPEALVGRLAAGMAVEVPFGARARARGFVVGFPAAAPSGRLRELLGIVTETTLPPALQDLLAWVARHYLCGLGPIYQAALPPGLLEGGGGGRLQLCVTLTGGLAPDVTRRQAQVLGVLTSLGGHARLAELLAAAGTTAPVVRALAAKGAVALAPERIRRAPVLPRPDPGQVPDPTPEQSAAVLALARAGRGEVFLLHGVTGSGKTEVYLRAIADVVERGETAIVLVPEIALTPQTVARFRARFGEAIAVLHSALADGERHDEWERLRHGEAVVAIGARSAIFAPCPRLGLIVVDEEHEGSYKQDSSPRYHARTVALRRAATEGARVILGSATPSLESFEKASRGQYQLLSLPRRVRERPLPAIEVVDMREELAAGHRAIFSRALAAALVAHVGRGEQSILLLNRRGYSSFVFCRACGEALRCPHCAVALTYHRAGEHLRCHYCDHRAQVPDRCPGCRSPYIRHFGAGTQQVAEAAQKLLPGARILRLDRDTTGTKDAHRQILEGFASGEADVLIGTQMVAKGHDLPRVTLVGVIAADAALYLPDFRAAERTFQLLTQVAGRAGRGDLPGRVLVQTYAPEHPAVVHAGGHAFGAFCAEELAARAELSYPPYAELVNLVFSAPDAELARAAAEAWAERLRREVSWRVLGPAPAPLAQLRGRHRVQVLVKAPELDPLREAVRLMLREQARGEDLRVTVDLEPVSML